MKEKKEKEEMINEKVFEEIPKQVTQLLSDYEKELKEGFSNFPADYKIGFAVKIIPSNEGSKVDVETKITFETEPQPKAESKKITDSMKITIDMNQMQLPMEKTS